MINPDDLLASLRRLIEHSRTRGGHVYMVDDFAALDAHLSDGGRLPEAWAPAAVTELAAARAEAVAGHLPTDVPSEPYVLHYTSQDYPVGETWSVYREQYVSRDHDEPIDGSQEHISTHATEAEADAEARRLQLSV